MPKKTAVRFCKCCGEVLAKRPGRGRPPLSYCSKACKQEGQAEEHKKPANAGEPTGIATRTCLRCGRGFLSLSPGNRICGECRKVLNSSFHRPPAVVRR